MRFPKPNLRSILELALLFLILTWSASAVRADQGQPLTPRPGPSGPPSLVASPRVQASGPDAPAQDIRDIRGPVPIPVTRWWILPSLGALVLILIGGILLLKRRRKTVRQPEAHETALMELERLRPLMRPDQARAFSYEVSGVLRRYLEIRFDLTPTRQTTGEFLKSAAGLPERISPGPWDDLDAFLNLCDLAKFGGWSLSRVQIEALFDTARKFVGQTAPKENGNNQGPDPLTRTGDLAQASQAA